MTRRLVKYPSCWRRLLQDRRGSIVPLAAVAIVALIGIGALAIELGNIYFVKAQNQRIADAAAIAAALSYGSSGNASVLTNSANNAALINGVSIGAVTASLGTSPSGSGNNAVRVTITTSVPLRLARAVGFASSANVAATGWAEIKTASTGCIVGLATSGNGVIEDGGASVTANGCAIGAKSNVNISGGSSLTAQGVYAGGTVTNSNSTITTKPIANNINQNYAGVSDPIAGNSALQTAFANLASLGGSVASPTTPAGGVTLAFKSSPTNSSDPTYPYYSGTGGLYNKGTLPCSGGGYAIDSITVGGGVSVTVNITAGCNYTVRNGVSNGGVLLNLVGTAGSWKVNDGTATYGISTGSGTTSLSANNFAIGGGINLGGSGSLTLSNATSFSVNGGITTGGSSITNFGSNVYDIAGAVNLSGVVNWQTSGANPDINFYNAVTLGSGGGTFTFGDGTYSVNGALTLSSGPSYFANAMLSINGNLAVSSGASLCSIPAPCGGGTAAMTIVSNGTVTFAGGSVSEISAPLTGATYGIPGVLIASNYASAPASYAMMFSGGTNGTYSGALYFPNASAEFSGGASTSGANCLQIVANVVYLTGGSTTAITCPDFNSGIGTAMAKLVQ